MQVVIRTIALLATAASIVLAQDANKLLNDFTQLQTSIKAMTSTTQGYSGGLAGTASVSSASGRVTSAMKQMASDANALSSLPDDESQKILTAVEGLIPDLQATLDAVVQKKSAFPRIFRPRVQTSLDQLTESTLTLTNQLKTKVQPALQPKIEAEGQKVDDMFKKASSDFRST
ncbi:hypothetical protein PYCC9005_002555 [Savitreella phatthalungensis]